MRKILFLFLVAACPAIYAEPELKGSPNELENYFNRIPKTVVVSGESEIKVPADKAIVNLGVTTENKSLKEALRLNQQVRTNILPALKNTGIPLERIQQSKFSSTPRFGMFGDKPKS